MSDDDRIEQIAREMCRSDGLEPDAACAMGPPQSPKRWPDVYLLPAQQFPMWRLYVKYAKLIVEDDIVIESKEDERAKRKH